MPTGTRQHLLRSVFVLLFTTAATAQSQILFTSEDAHVTLPQGMSLSLSTEAAPDRGMSTMPQVPAGQVIQTTLHRSVKGSSAKPSDPVELTLDYAIRIRGEDGSLSVPAGAKIVGYVAQVSPRDERSPKSQLGVVFERLVSGARQWSVRLKVVVLRGAKPFVNDPAQSKAYVQPPRSKQDAHSVLSHVTNRIPNR